MVKSKYLKISVIFFVFISLNIPKDINNTNGNSSLVETIAQPSPGPCAFNGYKTWNGGLFGTKAKDCWYDTIRRPLEECNISPE